MKKKAFTLIELVIVVVIIAILAMIAVPRIVDFQKEARKAAQDSTVESIRNGIKLYSIESALKSRVPMYPDKLDSAQAGSASVQNPFFGPLLQIPLTDGHWNKISDTIYQAPMGDFYIYDPAQGTFLKQ